MMSIADHEVGHLDDADYEEGWYWWLMDGDTAISPPHGPFDTAAEAEDNAAEYKASRNNL